MKRALTVLALVPAALAAPAWADCYTVFQRNLIVYRAEMTPIDLEPPIHTTLQKRFPGGQLVISSDTKTCTYIDPSSPVDPATGAAASPPDPSGRGSASFRARSRACRRTPRALRPFPPSNLPSTKGAAAAGR